MLTLGIETIVILLLIMGAVSAFGGYVFAQERHRRSGGGKSAAELRSELGEYKESVNEHFQTTAGLLHDMTEQYRAVYEHMASGAQNLCDPDTARTQIESLRAGLLPSAEAAGVAEAADEHASEEPAATVETDDEPANDGGDELKAATADDADADPDSVAENEAAADESPNPDESAAPDEAVSERPGTAATETHEATENPTETQVPVEEEKR